MTRADRKRLFDAMPPDERLLFIRRCATKLVLTPLGLCLMVFPFAALGLFFLTTKGIKVSEVQSALFVVGLTVLVAVGVCGLTFTRGRRLIDQMLEANNTPDGIRRPADGLKNHESDCVLKDMKRRNKILVLVSFVAFLLLFVFAITNRHRALVRQPRLCLQCLCSMDIPTGRWNHVRWTMDYFWNATSVHIDSHGVWHALPIYSPVTQGTHRSGSEPENQVQGRTNSTGNGKGKKTQRNSCIDPKNVSSTAPQFMPMLATSCQ